MQTEADQTITGDPNNKVNSSIDEKILIAGIDAFSGNSISQSARKDGQQVKIKDPRMLAFSEITTPDALSWQEQEDFDETTEPAKDSEDSEDKKQKKPYASYLVRLK